MKRSKFPFSSQLFIKNLIYTGTFMILFFIIFAGIMYIRSSNIMEEFKASAETQLENTASAIDTQLSDCRNIIATLHQNKLVHAFFRSLFPDSFTKNLRPVWWRR